MKTLHFACVVLLAALAGCGQKSISGMYTEEDSQSIGRLQINQSVNGDILGTLSGVSLKPDGTLDPLNLNLSGTTDEKLITFVVKSNASSMVMNVSATLDHGNVVMSMPGSNTPSSSRLSTKRLIRTHTRKCSRDLNLPST